MLDILFLPNALGYRVSLLFRPFFCFFFREMSVVVWITTSLLLAAVTAISTSMACFYVQVIARFRDTISSILLPISSRYPTSVQDHAMTRVPRSTNESLSTPALSPS